MYDALCPADRADRVSILRWLWIRAGHFVFVTGTARKMYRVPQWTHNRGADMNIERLQALASRLRTVDPAKFTLRGWRHADGRRCTSCLAAEMPEFALLGYHEVDGTPAYDGAIAIGAFRRFFDLEYPFMDYSQLVACDCDAPPSVIADRIDSLIAAELLRRGESPVPPESTVAASDCVDAGQMEKVAL